jgi:hypothetical protein
MSTVHELRTIRADLASAIQKVDRLLRRSLRGVESLEPEDVRELSMAKAIEWTLANSREVMTPSEIWHSLQDLGRTDRLDSVSVTTSDLATHGRIEKVARGKYRALSESSS